MIAKTARYYVITTCLNKLYNNWLITLGMIYLSEETVILLRIICVYLKPEQNIWTKCMMQLSDKNRRLFA